MDPSLCSLPAVEEIDLSRNKLTTVANLHNCVRLRRLDLGFNSIASLVGLNRVSVKRLFRSGTFIAVRPRPLI
jgi:Leucine-rich repeat (LRR) protein